MKVVVTSNVTQVSARYRGMARKMPNIVDRAMRDLVELEAVPLFQNTVRTWKHKPTFAPIETPRGWSVKVAPALPWGYVDQGTPPHVITARRAMLLRFTGPYHAKTKVNVIASYQGGRGRVWVSKRSVQHPGIEARNFRDIIMRRMQARAANKVREALNQASYGMGTGI
jgi:hypothetical protein